MNLKDLYRQVILDHYKNPHNKGLILDSKYRRIALNNPSCGDEITIQLLVDQNHVIQDLRHETVGCSICIASASIATQTLKGVKIDTAFLMIEQFYDLIMGLPYQRDLINGEIEVFSNIHQFPARIKCASLAWKAIEKGLKEEEDAR